MTTDNHMAGFWTLSLSLGLCLWCLVHQNESYLVGFIQLFFKSSQRHLARLVCYLDEHEKMRLIPSLLGRFIPKYLELSNRRCSFLPSHKIAGYPRVTSELSRVHCKASGDRSIIRSHYQILLQVKLSCSYLCIKQ